MKKRTKNFIIGTLSLLMVATTAVACSSSNDNPEKGPDYNYNYTQPLHAIADVFMNVDGKLDEEAWEGKNWLYCAGDNNSEIKSTTVFTPKGLYVGVYAQDSTIVWSNRYTIKESSGILIQVVREDAINYNDDRSYIHPGQHCLFNLDAKNALCRTENRFDAATSYDGDLNGTNSTYFSAELFLPWSELNYKEDELNADGTPNAVKVLVQYKDTDAGGFAGFTDDNQFETYYTYDKNGSTCTIDRNSETDTVGYSVNGWTPGDRWEFNEDKTTATNTVSRTQMLWFRKEVDGTSNSTGSHYIASVKVKAGATGNGHVGIITLKAKTLFNIYGVTTSDLRDKKTVNVSAGRSTNGMRSVWTKNFTKEYAKNYAGATVGDITLAKDEVYLTVVKRNDELYYFVNGEYVGWEFDARVAGECVVGIFANGYTTVSDWSFEDYSDKADKLDEYLNEYVWFFTSQDNGAGYVNIDNISVAHGEEAYVSVLPKTGYILKELTFNDVDMLSYFLENADDSAKLTFVPKENIEIRAKFEKLSNDGLCDVFFELCEKGNTDTKLLGATYVIRGQDKRFVYTGSANNKGNVVGSLLKAGTYTIGGETVTIDGHYSIEIICSGYKQQIFDVSLPADTDKNGIEGTLEVEAYPYGSVSVNGQTAASKGSYVYDYTDENANEYNSDASFEGFNKQYLKNTVSDGTYTFDGEITLTADAQKASNYGSIVGYALSSGSNYIEFKTAAWISDCLYLNYNSGCEIGFDNFPVENEGTNTGFQKEGATKKFKVVRSEDVIYVFNNAGVLCFMLTPDGIELGASQLVNGSNRLSTFNQGVKSFFAAGKQNVVGLYNLRTSNEGGGAYCYKYAFRNSANLSELISYATVELREGESYDLECEERYLADLTVELLFTNVPDSDKNYVAKVRYNSDEQIYDFMGSYNRADGEYSVDVVLKANATVWLEEYNLGSATVNDETLTGTKGTLIDNGDGTYKNDYDTNEDIVQYYLDKKANGDFKFNVEITTVDKLADNGGSGGDRGAEVGIVLACGNGLELSVFSKKAYLEQTQLCLRVGTNAGTEIAITGFSVTDGGNFASVGSKLIFSVERKDNTFIFYNQVGDEIFKVNSDGTITTIKTGVSITKCGDKNTAAVTDSVNAVQTRLATMLAKSETAFGIYRKQHKNGAYQWRVALNEELSEESVDGLGSATVNGEKLTGTKGTLVKTDAGTYKNEYDVNEDIVQYYTEKVQNGNFKLNVEITTVDQLADNGGSGGDRGAEVGIVLACGNGLELSVFSKKAYLEQTQLCLRVGTNAGTEIAITGFSVTDGGNFASVGSKLIFSVERKDNTFIFYNQVGDEIFKVNSDGTITTIKTGVSITKCGDKNTAANEDNVNAVQTRLAEMLAKGEETAFGIYRQHHNKGAYNWNVALSNQE